MTKAIIVRREGDYVITVQGADLLSAIAGQASAARDEAVSARDDAVSAAAATLAAAGVGEYPDTGAGLSGTTEGETFWVDMGDGTGQVYLHDPGPTATPLQKFITDPTDSGAADIFAGGVPTLAALDSPAGADMVGIQQAGAGTGVRTVADKALETLSVEDFYQSGDDDSAAWQKALDRLHARGGGTLVATQANYDLSAELVFDGTDLEGCAVIDARGAIMTSQSGVTGILAIEGNSNLCGIQIRNMTVDHTTNTTASYAFRQQGTARVSWPGCYVRGGNSVPSGYAAWLLGQTDPDDSDTACFWTSFSGAGCRGDFGPLPSGVILEGACNATDFYGFKSSNCVNHIVMRAPTGTTLPANQQPVGGNCVRVQGAWIEEGTTGVLFEGVPGGYGPFGLVVDCRAESLTNLVSLQGSTLDYPQAAIIYVQQTIRSVTNILINPNNLLTTVLDYRTASERSVVPTSGGWRYKGLDTSKDILDVDMAGVGHGLRWGVNGSEAASARYAASGVMELRADPSDNVGWAFTQMIGLSASNVRARNFVVSGTFAAGTTATVTFDNAEVDDKYEVLFFPTQNANFWATGRTTSGFTMNASATITGSIYAAIVRRR